MNINVNWEMVRDIDPTIEGDNSYCITFIFKDGTVCSYGYWNGDEFIKDYTKIMCDRRF